MMRQLSSWKKNIAAYGKEYEEMGDQWRVSNDKKKEAWTEQSRRSAQPEIDDDWGAVPLFTSSQANGEADPTTDTPEPEPSVEMASPSQRPKVERPISSAGGRAKFKALADIIDATESSGKKQSASSKKKRKEVESPEHSTRKKRKAVDGTASNVATEPSAQASHSRRRASKDAEVPEEADSEENELPPLVGGNDAADEQLNEQQAIARSALAAERLVSPDKNAEEGQAETPTKSRRSTRRKTRPTYNENVTAEEDGTEEVENDLPSPSAITPKRRRAQPASRKRAPARQRQKLQARQAANDGETSEQEFGYVDDEDESSTKYSQGYRQGKFSDYEHEQLARALEKYRISANIDQETLNAMIHAPGGASAGEEHKEMWAAVIEAIPGRHRQKIINITRKRFHNFVARGTWTQEQDAELGDLINTHGTKWAFIGSLINRHPEDLRDRYRNYLICGNSQIRQAWTDEEEAKLTACVISAQQAIDEYRAENPGWKQGKSYESLIDWKLISAKMGHTRSRLQCITKWKAMHLRTHPTDKVVSSEPNATINFRLESARRQIDSMPEEEKFRFVMAIEKTMAPNEDTIHWGRLVDTTFRSKWHRTTLVLLWNRLKQSVPNWKVTSTRDCAEFLMAKYNEEHRFPNVSGEGWDDEEEMILMESVPYLGSSVRPVAEPVSSEYVAAHSENEEDGEQAPEATAMEIDPALEDESEGATAIAATPAKRTSTGKRPGGRRPQRPADKAASTPTKKARRKGKAKAVAQPEEDDDSD